MPKLNISVSASAYADSNPTNNPSMNHFKWSRSLNGVLVAEPRSIETVLAPSESVSMLNSQATLASDITTELNLSLKPGTQSTYILKNTAGAAPNFKIKRQTGADATTEITVTKNGPVVTISSSAGTPLSLLTSPAVVGDQVKLGSLFSSQNQGVFAVLSVSATSVSFKNENGVPEVVVLGAGFDEELRVFSVAGVQKGDKLLISQGFSPASFGTYEITFVQDNLIEFYSTQALPQEVVVGNNAIVYTSAKKMVYIESDKEAQIIVNGQTWGNIKPLVDSQGVYPASLLVTATVYSISIINKSNETSKVYMASVE